MNLLEDTFILNVWEKTAIPTVFGVAKECGCSESKVRRVLENNNIKWEHSNKTGALRELEGLRDECNTILAKIFEGKPASVKQDIKLPAKLIFHDDHHIPFVNFDHVGTMLANDGDADGFVWGEMLNLDAFSYFIKNYQSNPLQEDAVAGKLVDLYMKHFKYGFTIETNHTKRIAKFLAGVSSPEILEYFKKSFNNLLPPFMSLNSKLKYINAPIVQVGRAIHAHFDEFLSVPLSTVRRVQSRLRNYADAFGIDNDYQALFIGHTHNMGITYIDQKMVAETGCMCYLQDYVLAGKGSAAMANFRWVNGYAVVYLNKDGSVDFINTRLKFLGFAQRPEIKHEG